MKILIIEDNPSYQNLLKTNFEKEKFEVSVCNDVERGKSEVSENRPDIILLDIILPGGVNGFDFLEQLKSDRVTKKIPVVVISNLETEEKVSNEIGASSYFVKSNTTIEQIVKRAKQLLNYQ